MGNTKFSRPFNAVLILVIASLACGQFTSAPAETPTAAPTATATIKPTATKPPTSTPKPTATPNAAATQKFSDFNAHLEKIMNDGYIDSANGKALELNPFKEEWAQLGWYNWWILDGKYADFVFKSHFKWSSAYDGAEVSGCGIVFGLQENREHYAIFLDKSRILFLMSRGGRAYEVGKTHGTGRVSFSNPAEANFTAIIKGQKAFVSVDDQTTEYTLSEDQSSAGAFGYTLLSGTNRDYGTRCEMTDTILWTPDK
ncbi:MAG: hypothetical protein PHQ36_03670 [Anaerolineales bacterium]|nr:hypothetical protein [Anaerolineales bacterium]